MVLLLTWQIDLGSTYKTKIDQSSNNLDYSSILCLHNPGGAHCMKCAWHLATSGAALCRVKCSCEERHRETSPAEGEQAHILMLCSPQDVCSQGDGDTVPYTHALIPLCLGTIR